jgi:hypothetical protein
MRPDEIAIDTYWTAVEGWNPGLADAACFATVHWGARRHSGRVNFTVVSSDVRYGS